MPGSRASPASRDCAACRSTSPGILHRVARLADNPGRDRTWQTEVEQATTLYLDAGGTLPLAADTPARLAEVRWMLEELRLSLFAQHLGAAGPVSVQRIRKALNEPLRR